MNSNKSIPIIAIVLILLFFCLCCLCLAAAGVFIANVAPNAEPSDFTITEPWVEPWNAEPTPEVTIDPGTINLEPDQLAEAHETLEVLNENIVPINDPIDLVGRLGGEPGVPDTLIDENAPYNVGAQIGRAHV